MRLNALAKAIQETGRPRNCFSILIYGGPKTGKSRLAATVAKVPWIRNVYWLDIENGADTLVTMVNKDKVLTPEEASKIVMFSVPDTAAVPRAFETVTKMLFVKKDLHICEEHGRVDCKECKTALGTEDFPGEPFNISKCTEEDVIVLDTGSALGDSILNYHCLGKGENFKPGWDEYQPQGETLKDAMLVVQAAQTNFIVLTHELSVEYEEEGTKTRVEEIYPLMGTKNFSKRVAKFFSHVLYLELKLGKHKGGSSSTYKKGIVTGSRSDWRIENHTELDLSVLFKEMGVVSKAAKK